MYDLLKFSGQLYEVDTISTFLHTGEQTDEQSDDKLGAEPGFEPR